MTNLSVFDLLKKVYGAKGIAFPTKATTEQKLTTTEGFNIQAPPYIDKTIKGGKIRKYTDAQLGKYEFMPVEIDGIEMPNAVIIISGEKEIIETNVIDAGTVFEKVFVKPYDITVIATLIGFNGQEYPETEMKQLTDLWKKDDVVTVRCALTDFFLQNESNAIITKISVLDNAGAECVEIIQFDLRSNIDFELEIN